jgi:hypothetical protein
MNRVLEVATPWLLRSGGVAASLLGCSLSTAFYAACVAEDGAALALYAEALRDRRVAASEALPAEDLERAGAKDAALAANLVVAEARLVARHAASTCALGLWSCASAYWAFVDLRAYRSLTPLELEKYCARMPFPMLRTSSLAAFSVSSAAVFFGAGGLRFQPTTPPHLGAARRHQGEGSAAAVLLRRWRGG